EQPEQRGQPDGEAAQCPARVAIDGSSPARKIFLVKRKLNLLLLKRRDDSGREIVQLAQLLVLAGPAAQLGWVGGGDGAGKFRGARADRANQASGGRLEFLDLADELVDVGARIAQRPRVRAHVEVQRGETDDPGRSLLSSFARR